MGGSDAADHEAMEIGAVIVWRTRSQSLRLVAYALSVRMRPVVPSDEPLGIDLESEELGLLALPPRFARQKACATWEPEPEPEPSQSGQALRRGAAW